MVAIRFFMNSTAKNIKSINSNAVVLAANAAIARFDLENIPFPEEWIMHYVDGKKLTVWGGDLMNITEKCPLINFQGKEQQFNDWLAEYLVQTSDWNYFDGIFIDGWVGSLAWRVSDVNKENIDIDYNGKADKNAFAIWDQGNRLLIDKIRQEFVKQGLANKVIIPHEYSTNTYFNGNAFEFWTQETLGARYWNIGQAARLLTEAVEPRIVYANSEAGNNKVPDLTSYNFTYTGTFTGPVFRADFTSAQIAGTFFGHDEGSAHHRYTFMHDEYEGDLGYSTESTQTIKDMMVRYYDNGVIISNISGSGKRLCPSELTGGPYYRFLGNQDPNWNNGSEFTSSSCINLEGLDGIMLFKKQITLVTPIIIDNVEYNMTTIGQEPVKYKGDWKQSLDCPFYCKTRQLGEASYGMAAASSRWGSYFAFSAPGTGQNTAEYRPKINIPGRFEIFEWHGNLGEPGPEFRGGPSAPSKGDEATNVPYEIYIDNKIDNKLVETRTIDQTKNQGGWNSLGVFDVKKGEEISVKISNNANGYVISDAIKFVNLASFIKEYEPIPPKVLSADFNCDNKIDIQDFGILLSHWHKLSTDQSVKNTKRGQCASPKTINIFDYCKLKSNNNIKCEEKVDIFDLSLLLSCWGAPDATKTTCWTEQAQ